MAHTIGLAVEIHIGLDGGEYQLVPFGFGHNARPTGFHELRVVSDSQINVGFSGKSGTGWYSYTKNLDGKYTRKEGNNSYVEVISSLCFHNSKLRERAII